MTNTTRRYLAAPLLIAAPTLFTAAFALLASRFDYPDVLRQPPGDVLARFHAAEASLLPLWWAMLCAALLFVPASALAADAAGLRGGRRTLAVVFGTLAGLAQALGLSRWVFLAPLLSERYTDPTASDATRQTALLLFEAFHLWAGAGIGEWLGYLFTALWTLLVAASLPNRRWLALPLAASAAGILAGLLEPFGVAGVGAVNAAAYLLWSLCIVTLGVVLSLPNRTRRQPLKGIPSMKSLFVPGFMSLIAIIAISPARAQQQQSPAARDQIYLHAFRSPSVGAEYRTRDIGLHAGLYTTILGSSRRSTEFFKAGVTAYFGGGAQKRLEGFASLAYVRGLNRDYGDRDGLFAEAGVRYALARRVDLRIGAGLLAAEGNRPRVNPTIGISYRIPLK